MKRFLLYAVVAGTLACFVACGGRVIIDEEEQGVGGGSSVSSSTAGQSVTTGSGVLCSWPKPIGDIVDCGGSVGAGPPPQCSTVICDVNKNEFEALCEGSACQCRYNGQTMCTCALSPPLDICAGAALPCCPIPGQ